MSCLQHSVHHQQILRVVIVVMTAAMLGHVLLSFCMFRRLHPCSPVMHDAQALPLYLFSSPKGLT
jgi:hypothetical protein